MTAPRVTAPPNPDRARGAAIEALAAKGQNRSAKDTADLLNLLAGEVVDAAREAAPRRPSPPAAPAGGR